MSSELELPELTMTTLNGCKLLSPNSGHVLPQLTGDKQNPEGKQLRVACVDANMSVIMDVFFTAEELWDIANWIVITSEAYKSFEEEDAWAYGTQLEDGTFIDSELNDETIVLILERADKQRDAHVNLVFDVALLSEFGEWASEAAAYLKKAAQQ